MKLNNRAFAASTVLYGILTITLLLMMLILATMKSSNKLNASMADVVENQLNNCIEDAQELDNCRLNQLSTNCQKFQNVYGKCIRENIPTK